MSENKSAGANTGRFFEHALEYTAIASGFITLALSFLIASEVVLRYIFRRPLGWQMELSQYMMYLLVMLPVAYTLLARGHIAVDAFIIKLPQSVRNYWDVGIDVVVFIYAVIAAWQTGSLTLTAYQLGWRNMEVLTVPLAPLYVWMPISMTLLAVAAVLQAYRDAVKARTKP